MPSNDDIKEILAIIYDGPAARELQRIRDADRKDALEHDCKTDPICQRSLREFSESIHKRKLERDGP